MSYYYPLLKMSHPKTFCQNIKFTFMVIPMFLGYSCLANLQRYMKEQLHCSPGQFAFAYSFLYLTNLIFRLCHNFVWVFCKPFWRMVIGYCFMITSMSLCLIIQCVSWDKDKNNQYMAILAFLVGGVGIGTFGSNLLNVVSLISVNARFYACFGIPIGINFINIFSFMIIQGLQQWFSSNQVLIFIFASIICFIFISLILMFTFLPHGPFIEKKGYTQIGESVMKENETTTSLSYFALAFKNSKDWLRLIYPNILAWLCHGFCNTQFTPGIVLYTIHPTQQVRIFKWLIDTNYFRTILASFNFLADMTSRIAFEKIPKIFPFLFCYLDLLGVLLIISGITELTIVGGMIVTFGGGAIYQQCSFWVREATAGTQWNLIGYSLWLFCGDVGNVIASYTQQSLAIELCETMSAKLSNTKWVPCPYYREKQQL